MVDIFGWEMAARRGWSVEETPNELLEVSGNVQTRGFMTRATCSSRRKALPRRRNVENRGVGDSYLEILLHLFVNDT